MIQLNSANTPSAISLSGPQAGKFLQGQLTCDVLALQNGQQTLGAYCNVKGKVESLFTLMLQDDAYVLLLQDALVQPTLQELQKYVLFSKVKLEICENTFTTKGTQDADAKAAILAKIPELYPQTVGKFFPHDLNLPALGAVNFTKGCYRGQEIVARMQNRGNIKRGLYIFTAQNTQIFPGDEIVITESGKPAGTVVRTCLEADGLLGLAVIGNALCGENLQACKGDISSAIFV